MNAAVKGLLEALREIARPSGVLCRECGQTLPICDTDMDTDECAGKLARAALAAFEKREPLSAESLARETIAQAMFDYRAASEPAKMFGACITRTLDAMDTAVLGPREPTKEGM